MVRFSGEWVWKVICWFVGTAEAERLRLQRVARVVAERLGGVPGQAVRAQLAGDRSAFVVVDHRDRAEDAVLGADRHWLIHRHTDGAVLDRRGELRYQQVAERACPCR